MLGIYNALSTENKKKKHSIPSGLKKDRSSNTHSLAKIQCSNKNNIYFGLLVRKNHLAHYLFMVTKFCAPNIINIINKINMCSF